MNAPKLERFIKDKSGDKTPMATTSVNLEKRQLDFLKLHNLNLSKIIREHLDSLIKESSDDSTDL